MADNDIILNPDNFPSNSNKDKEEEKRAIKTIEGKVKKASPSFLRKATNVIFSNDLTENDIKSELIYDYLVPTIKDTLATMGKMLLDAIFYGTMKPKAKGNSPVKVSYSNYYDNSKNVSVTTSSSHLAYDFDNYAFESRRDAEDTLNQLIEMIDVYNVARVADFFDIIKVTAPFTTNRYGWTDLTHTRVSRTKDGWVIDFPTPVVLKD